MKKYSLLGFLLCGLFLLSVSPVEGTTLEIESGEVTEISPPDTLQAGRLLIGLPLPGELDGATIDFAQLEINLGIEQAENRPVTLECCALVTDWDVETVSWSEPWSNPGGDLSDSNKTVFTFYSGGEVFCRADITYLVQGWANGGANYGLILKAVNDQNLSLSRLDTSVLPPGAKARVRVWYTSREAEGQP